MAYLKDLPATELKIDKAFVLDIADSQRASLLVRSTIDLGHSLGMQVTAEGVETAMALWLLALMGCDSAQGYFIGRPMPLGNLIEFLKRDPEEAMQIAPAGSLTNLRRSLLRAAWGKVDCSARAHRARRSPPNGRRARANGVVPASSWSA